MRAEHVRQGRKVIVDGAPAPYSGKAVYHIIGGLEELYVGIDPIQFTHILNPKGFVSPILIEQLILPKDDPDYEE